MPRIGGGSLKKRGICNCRSRSQQVVLRYHNKIYISSSPISSGQIDAVSVDAKLRRSEERRVGKECRSLCDWSSDVCSSDLDTEERPAGCDSYNCKCPVLVEEV